MSATIDKLKERIREPSMETSIRIVRLKQELASLKSREELIRSNREMFVGWQWERIYKWCAAYKAFEEMSKGFSL